MVLQKRLDYGFNGYQVPAMPRGYRSARGRCSRKRKFEETQMDAFELLATVAGNLLQERETSPAFSNVSSGRAHAIIVKDNVKQEQQDEEKSLKVEPCDQGSSRESGFQGHNQNNSLKEFTHAQNDNVSGPASLIANCDISEKVGCAEDTVIGKIRNSINSSKVKGRSSDKGKYYKGKSEDGIKKIGNLINGTVPDTCSSDDPLELDTKPHALVSSDTSIEVPLLREHLTCGLFPGCQDVKLVSRDDDENSSGCTQPSITPLKASRPPPHIEDRKIRKLLTSKCWEVAPKLEGEFSNTDGDMRPVSHSRKICYKRQRSLRDSFKRRKVEKSSVSTSDGGASSEGISSTPKKGTNGSTIGSGSSVHGGSGVSSSSAAGQESSSQSRDSHVKLSIKSFEVPELFIEIPETATIGSLKRTVMEAVAAILGEGLHVGVLYQGKKIQDDSETLLQTGICDDDKLDGLGFSLEPNHANAPASLCLKDPPFLCPCDAPQPLTRYRPSPALDLGFSDASLDPPSINLANGVESDHDSVPSPTDMSIDKNTPESRALVAVPAMSVEALAVVPLHRKSRRAELAQRRIRRPFSVSEVEALVQAVEKLGTGRWRDVKLRAFDNAKHRTYVDLKDKWKTLVHTARISPQQRRGEPVPQELLDRVLAAHAYWSQQQAKQQVKQLTETCILLNS